MFFSIIEVIDVEIWALRTSQNKQNNKINIVTFKIIIGNILRKQGMYAIELIFKRKLMRS